MTTGPEKAGGWVHEDRDVFFACISKWREQKGSAVDVHMYYKDRCGIIYRPKPRQLVRYRG